MRPKRHLQTTDVSSTGLFGDKNGLLRNASLDVGERFGFGALGNGGCLLDH